LVAVRAERWHCTTALLNTLRQIGRNSSTSLPVAALLAFPFLLVSLAQWAAFSRHGFQPQWIFVWLLLLMIGLFTTSIWLQASIVKATPEFAAGSDPGILGMLKQSLSRTPSLLGALLLIGLMLLAAAMIASVPALGILLIAAAAPGPIKFGTPLVALVVMAGILGLAIFLFLAIVIFFRYALAPAAVVLEDKSPSAALDRSRELMQGRWVDFFLLTLMVWAVTLFVQLVVGTPAFLVSFGSRIANPSSLFSSGPGLSPAAALITAVSAYLVQVASPLVSVGARANFYLEIKNETVESSSGPGDGRLEMAAARDDDGDSHQQQDSSGEDKDTGNLSE
jgi:hypothetical protein